MSLLLTIFFLFKTAKEQFKKLKGMQEKIAKPINDKVVKPAKEQIDKINKG